MKLYLIFNDVATEKDIKAFLLRYIGNSLITRRFMGDKRTIAWEKYNLRVYGFYIN